MGTVLSGRWRIVRMLGTGGMGTVYEAVHRNGKHVAIKILHPDLRLNALARARFLREGYIANRVGHAGVPSVLDDGETDDGDAFLVMDFLSGQTLETCGKASQFSAEDVLAVADEVLDVLAAAHEKGIVHRDIKPANVFVTTAGVIKVLDFGIASLREALAPESSTLTPTGASLGTPAFMAPEQARGRWQLVDARTDVWATGALMFTLLTGRTVHDAETPNEALIAAATAPAPALSSLRPDLPAELSQLVDRALALHRERRFPDAGSMQRAIRSISTVAAGVRTAQLAAAMPTSTTQSEHATDQSVVFDPVRRSRRSRPMASLAVVTLLLGAGAWWGLAQRHEPAKASPLVRRADGDPVRPVSDPGLVQTQRSAAAQVVQPPALAPVAAAQPMPRPSTRAVSLSERGLAAPPQPQASAAFAAPPPQPENAAPAAPSSAGLWSPEHAWLDRQK